MNAKSSAFMALAVVGLLAIVAGRFHFGGAVVGPDEQAIQGARDYLLDHPAVPDLDAQVARALVGRVSPEGEEQQRVEAAIVEDVVWESLPRVASDLAHSAVFSPGTLDVRSLLRHPALNPGDAAIPFGAWAGLEGRLSSQLDDIRRLASLEATIADREMRALVDAGLVRGEALEVTDTADGRKFAIPAKVMAKGVPVYGALMVNGMGYSFTLRELAQTFTTVQSREVLVLDYLQQVADFLSDEDVLSRDAATGFLGRYYERSQTLQ